MRKRMICTLASAMVISATAAFGAIKEGSFSVTPLIGGYNYDKDLKLDNTLLIGLRAGYNFTKNIGVEALYDYGTKTDTASGTLPQVSIHRVGGQALYHFFPDNVLVPYLAAGLSGLDYIGTGNSKSHGVFDYGVGAKYFLTDDFALRGDVRNLLYTYKSTSYSNFEYTLGAYLQFGAPAPAVKAVAPAPAPVVEPAKPEVAPEPAPAPPADSDKDGVIDSLDKCPGTPAGVAVDSKGCPIDSDNDGVADYLDKCPSTPAGVVVDNNGCPVPPAKPTCSKPAISSVLFDFDKAEVKSKYNAELDKLGEFLKESPTANILIEGHTDNEGNKAYNMKLSKRRAVNARSYIVKKFGIDGSRISTKGFGFTKPVTPNRTAADKASNRRIEAVLDCK